jgi:uncharacterized protein
VSEESVAVALPTGTVEVPADLDVPDAARLTVVLAHGAGAGRRHPFLAGLARGLGERAVATMRFDFPYVAAGRRMPGPAAHAIAAWRDVLAWAGERGLPGPIWAAGKSYGGRMASMAAAQGVIAPAGLVYLGYPLHPPGSPEKTRAAHLPDIVQPQFFVSGTRDPFVDPHAQLVQAVSSCREATLRWIEGGGHSFEVAGRRRAPEDVGGDLAGVVIELLRPRP